MIEQPKTKSDVLESIETMIRNAEHPLMDDGEVIDAVEADDPRIHLRLRDGSVWAVDVACMIAGVPREYDDEIAY
jgi:hypothetical protein